ncbi:RagB/SusD family nutrient uptake outer membrane protein [uncultured Acetobacteroides sp.]|uniref:RagB/SusD family nutrient uptake outer membrane protein n=1 Tax=uncultured Acetobacteroides sp. TaxID=1760811 RepID=UPI0029F5AF9D|nr:RagB/SusD family nutrient uptake outer membrane protein [uncultured Acetobacteroides sp.]
MKLNKIAIFIVGVMFSAASCTSDLDVTPIDPSQTFSKDVFSNATGYKQALAKLYAAYAVSGQQGPSGKPDIIGIDEGFGNYFRQLWNAQELSTDEAIMAWNDATIKDFHYQTWTPNDTFIAALYSRIFYAITIENEYIRDANEFMSNLSAADQEKAKKFILEARFLRALSYYHAIDMFGNVPFVTEEDKPGSFFPKQIKRADLFKYIETELLAIEKDMVAPRANEYGRADQAAAWTLLAKLYLNASVYNKENKPSNDAIIKWNTECAKYCEKVISGGYSVENTPYRNNFLADNNTSNEIIYAIAFDGSSTTTYGGTTYLVHAAIGGSMKANEFGVGGGWGGIRTTKALVNKFPAPQDASADKRAMFYSTDQTLDINDVAQFGQGWAITKFRNVKANGSPATHAHPDFVDVDFPVFRLADVYLMYAEAVKRGSTEGTEAQAIIYINKLRERAYGNTSGNITSYDLPFILDERSRELYWEGHRRSDLIRFGQFSNGSYVWPWKGNVAAGTSTDGYRDLYPIPTRDKSCNPNLTQNVGY